MSVTHTSAVILMPPPALWPAINRLRQGHDRRYRRWMPHITLLFPLVDRLRIAELRPRLQQATAELAPFELELRQFAVFAHHRRAATVYLVPEPQSAVQQLRQALCTLLPEFDDRARAGGGFTPHLTIGQAAGAESAAELTAALAALWQPISWRVTAVQVVWRNFPPDDVMRPGYEVPFGRAG
jgi:RNA 2',3'-cyclic 3'-phosphodiesterase